MAKSYFTVHQNGTDGVMLTAVFGTYVQLEIQLWVCKCAGAH